MVSERHSFQHRIATWLKDPYHITLLFVLIGGFLLRYFFYDINLGLWWDEGEYLAKAKNWAFGTVMPNAYWTARPVTLTLLWALLLKLGASVTFLRFTTELLPSVGTILLMYLVGKEMYNKKIGIIAATMLSVFWLHLFFTARLLMDLPGLFFSLLTIYFFWKGFIKEQGRWYQYLTPVFFLLTALTKYNDGVILLAFAVCLFVKERFALFQQKKLWYALGLSLLVILVPYLLFNYISFGDPLPALTTYIFTAKTSAIHQFAAEPPAWYILNYFYEYLFTFWLIIFFIGVLLGLWKFFLSFDLLIKRKDLSTLNDLFCVLLIVLPLLFFVFLYKFAVHQYLFLITPAIFLIMAKGTLQIHDFLARYNKHIGVGAVVAILAVGGYYQLDHGIGLLEAKKTTYSELREAGLWIKEHTSPDEPVMLTSNQMEFGVFAERRIVNEGSNTSQFEEHLARERPRYLVLSLLSDNPNYPWVLPLLQGNKDRFVPVQAWFADKERKQPRAVIYKIADFAGKNDPPVAL